MLTSSNDTLINFFSNTAPTLTPSSAVVNTCLNQVLTLTCTETVERILLWRLTFPAILGLSTREIVLLESDSGRVIEERVTIDGTDRIFSFNVSAINPLTSIMSVAVFEDLNRTTVSCSSTPGPEGAAVMTVIHVAGRFLTTITCIRIIRLTCELNIFKL